MESMAMTMMAAIANFPTTFILCNDYDGKDSKHSHCKTCCAMTMMAKIANIPTAGHIVQ